MSVISFDAPMSVVFSHLLTSVYCNGLPQQFSHIHHLHIAVAFTRVDAILEHRHAERATDGDDVRAGLQSLSRALLIDAFVLRLFNGAHSAAAAAAESLFPILLHLHG